MAAKWRGSFETLTLGECRRVLRCAGAIQQVEFLSSSQDLCT